MKQQFENCIQPRGVVMYLYSPWWFQEFSRITMVQGTLYMHALGFYGFRQVPIWLICNDGVSFEMWLIPEMLRFSFLYLT
jgi:hypothetical protein